MFAFFRAGAPAGPSAPIVLKDAQTGAVTRPTLVRSIALDPSDPTGNTIDAALVAFPGDRTRAVALQRRSSGEAVLVDFDLEPAVPSAARRSASRRRSAPTRAASRPRRTARW
jgi:hypothetical protein